MPQIPHDSEYFHGIAEQLRSLAAKTQAIGDTVKETGPVLLSETVEESLGSVAGWVESVRDQLDQQTSEGE